MQVRALALGRLLEEKEGDIITNTYELSTGQTIPALGFGTWEIAPDTTKATVLAAIEAGYRLIDTAKIYNNEGEVGAAVIATSVPRSELFVTTKLWNDDQGFESTKAACAAALQRMGLDYLDLFLIHWPATSRRLQSWQAMVELQQAGKLKAIGVSNYTVRHLEELLAESPVRPAVNQVELHPFIYDQQRELLEFCRKHDILVEAYSPLARTSKFVHPTIRDIANRIGKLPTQVVLRWCVQHGTVPLPRSGNPEHMASNLAIFDFELEATDMAALDALSDGRRVTWDPAEMR